MIETVVHVTTLEQWRSVLDVWFKQGNAWPAGDKEYSARTFETGGRFLFLDDYITYSKCNPDSKPFIEYEEFMAKKKEVNKMKTVYVTREQLDLIKDLKNGYWPLARLVNSEDIFRPLNNGLEMVEEKAILRYLGGDTSIEFKVKEQLYRLWRNDGDNDKVYMSINSFDTPDWTYSKENSFTATLDEIKKWQTPAWEIEKAD